MNGDQDGHDNQSEGLGRGPQKGQPGPRNEKNSPPGAEEGRVKARGGSQSEPVSQNGLPGDNSGQGPKGVSDDDRQLQCN